MQRAMAQQAGDLAALVVADPLARSRHAQALSDLMARSRAEGLSLDDDDTVSVGSRGLCYSKRTLEILDRLGVGDDTVAKGVSWNVGRTFFNEEEVFNFNLLPQADFKRPGMVNLQQYYLEEYEIKRAKELPSLDLRFRNKVVSVSPNGKGATLQVWSRKSRASMSARRAAMLA